MDSLEEFRKNHPYVDSELVPHLYRFKSIRDAEDSHLEDLFVHKKLYHPKPFQLNDPFECRPHFKWPETASATRDLRRHLAYLLRSEKAMPRKEADSRASQLMKNRDLTRALIWRSGIDTYGQLRICSFTTAKEHLLFWSHYGDSHRGMCLEFDSRSVPINFARRVVYQEDYPIAQFPAPANECSSKPALVKSPAWQYEQEYRIIFTPGSTVEAPNDGQSLYLEKSALTAIYFGANAEDADKDRVLSFLRRGDFQPEVYDAELAESTFSVRFRRRGQV